MKRRDSRRSPVLGIIAVVMESAGVVTLLLSFARG